MARNVKNKTGNGVSKTNAKHDEMALKWKRARDVVAGQDTIHKEGKAYLPLLVNEDAKAHKSRVERTPFYNASWRTIAGFVGMLFNKPPVLEVSEKIKLLLEDVTMSGVTFENFCQNIVYEDFITSRVGILVDYPALAQNEDGSPLTVAQTEALNLRPSMAMFPAESILPPKTEFINNRTVLTQVRLREELYESSSEFDGEYKPVIRVLDLVDGVYRQRVFDANTEEQIGATTVPTMNGKPLDYIPFYFVGPDGTESAYEPPVLDDLFTHNIKHYQAYADYINACHMTALPTPWITGYSNDAGFVDPALPAKAPVSFDIGSTTAWVFPDPNTKVGFLEYQGGGISSLKELKDGFAEEMASIGARMLAPEKSGVEAEGTLAIRHRGENSIVGAVGNAASEGLSKALLTFALWGGDASATAKNTKLTLSRDFLPFIVSPQLITSWLAAVQAGRMSAEVFFLNMQRGDQMPSDRTFEAEQAAIDNDPIPRPVQAGNPKVGVDGLPVDPVEEAARMAEIAKKNEPPKKAT